MIHHSTEHFHCSGVQWCCALHHSRCHLALCTVIVGLCWAAQGWKPISWSSQCTVLVLMLLTKAVWNFALCCITHCSWCLHAMCFSTLQPCSVSLCGLSIHGQAVIVFPRRFHFTIALAIDQGRHFLTWLVAKVTSCYSTTFLLPVFVYEDCITMCLILCTGYQHMAETPELNN